MAKLNLTKKKKIIIIGSVITVAVLIVVGVGAFLIIRANSSQNSPITATAGGQFFGRGGAGGGANFANIRGTISSLTDKTAVIDSDNNQGEKIVLLSETTNITKSEAATATDVVKTGNTVTIAGTLDGTTITATSVTLSEFNFGGSSSSAGTVRTRGGNGGPGGFGGGIFPAGTARNMFVGQIESTDNGSFKIKDFRQDEYTVTTSSDTKYLQQVSGTLSDVKSGEAVTVVGSTSSNGTVTARNLTVM